MQTGIRDISSLLGQFDFSGRFTGGNGRWENALAGLCWDFRRGYQQGLEYNLFNIYQHMYFSSFRDDWKLTRNFRSTWESDMSLRHHHVNET